MALNSGEKRQTQFHEVKPNERSEANNWKIALRIFRLLVGTIPKTCKVMNLNKTSVACQTIRAATEIT